MHCSQRVLAIFSVAALALSLGCSPPTHVVVTVEGLPASSVSLEVQGSSGDRASINNLAPFALPQPTHGSTTFLLSLPDNLNGLSVSVAAFAGENAQGCLLATGSAETTATLSGRSDLRIALAPVNDTRCTGERPLLLGATPALGSSAGGEAITLTGWGFKPGASVLMGTKPAASVRVLSAATLEAMTPPQAGFGPTPIKVVNPDQSQSRRQDLFRFYAPSLSFTGFPVSGASDIGGGVVSRFDPTTTADIALTLTYNNSVRVLYTIASQIITSKTAQYPVGNQPGPLVAADFDRDGDNDLAVANIGDGTVQLLNNLGDGHFTVGLPIVVGSAPEALVASDLDSDGSPDLVVANRYPAPATGKVRILLNDGQGRLTLHGYAVDVGVEPVGLAIGDFNVDGLPDIVAANRAPLWSTNQHTITVLYNQGGGTFSDRGTAAANLLTCKEPTSVLVTDVNSNGIDDVLVSCSGDSMIQIWDNLGGFNIRDYALPTDTRPRNLAMADLNGDGYADLVVPAETGGVVNFFLNQKGAGFEGVSAIKKPTPCANPYQVFFIDYDLDNKADVGVVGNQCIGGFFNQSM